MIKIIVEQGDCVLDAVFRHSESDNHVAIELEFDTKYPKLNSSHSWTTKKGQSRLTMEFSAATEFFGGGEPSPNPTKVTFHGLGGRSCFDHERRSRYNIPIIFYRLSDDPKTIWENK